MGAGRSGKHNLELTVFVVVIGAAVLHAVWNARVKGGRDKRLTMTAVVPGHAPFATIVVLIVPIPNQASFR